VVSWSGSTVRHSHAGLGGRRAGICSRPELGSRGPRRIRAVEQPEQWERGAAGHQLCVGFDDPVVVTLRAPLKNLGNGTLSPTSNNDVTISRYHVEYIRADGRNTPGVDVPYPFDGAVTGTIVAGTQTSFTFELVRHVAKQESPLVQLVRSSNIITTIARVSFYGQDRTGNAVSVTGDIQVNFGNFGDF